MSEDKKIIVDLITRMEKKYDLNFVGLGESGNKEGYTSIDFNFTKLNMTKDQGRALIIELKQYALDEINHNEKMQSYLLEKPFTNKNLGIVLYNKNAEQTRLYFPTVSTFSLTKDKLRFYYHTPEVKYGFPITEEESIEEALSIIKYQQKHEK